jgi:hypothetical protein
MTKFKLVIFVLPVFLCLFGCGLSSSDTSDNLPDSLFSYRLIANTYGFEDALKHDKKLTRFHYIKWIKPYIEKTYNVKIDTSQIMMDDFYYVSKLKLNSSYNSVIIEAEGEDMQGLILITIDNNGDYIDSYHLAGIIGCSGAWEADSGYYETCTLRNSLIESCSVITNIKKCYFKPLNDSVNFTRLDSINYKIEVNSKGQFTSSELDSIRVYRYEN